MKKKTIIAGLAALILTGALFFYQGGAQTSVLSSESCNFKVYPEVFDLNSGDPIIFQILEQKPMEQNFQWEATDAKLAVSTDTRNAVLFKRNADTVITVKNGACKGEIRGKRLTEKMPQQDAKRRSNPDSIPLTLPYPPLSVAVCKKLEISPKNFLPDINEQAFTADIEPAEFSGVVKWTHFQNGKTLEIKTGFRAIFDNLNAESKIEAEAFPKKTEGDCSISVLPE